MGGKPNPGTAADKRLTDNQTPSSGTRVTSTASTKPSNSSGSRTTAGNTQPYNTYMPWA